MKVVDLFAGAGGMTQGAKQAGLEVVASFDSWDVAVETHKANFEHDAFMSDLNDVKKIVPVAAAFEPDLIVGGPPCQDFSHAGGRVEGARAELTTAFAKIVTAISPDAFVMENVPSAISSQAYSAAREIFKKHGYGLTEIVLDASLFGVPQRRKRLFVIGILGEQDNILKKPLSQRQSLFPLTVRRAIPDLGLEHYYRHPRSYARRGVFSIDEPSPTIRGVNRPKPADYTYHPGDTSNLDSVRSLTQNERARIQTFDADFTWVGSRTETEQMTGNAVPPNLAQHVLTALSQFIDSRAASEKHLKSEIATYPTPSELAIARKFERTEPLNVGESISMYKERAIGQDGYRSLTSSQKDKLQKVLNYFILKDKNVS